VRSFLDRHLPGCRCPRGGPRARITVRAALRRFVAAQQRDGYAPPPVSDVPPAIAIAVADFDEFLRETCGLAENTRLYRCRYAKELLQVVFGSGPIDVRRLSPADVERFVTMRARHCSRGSARVIAASVRSWLRYQQFLGAADARLLAAVPRIPSWRLAGLPAVIGDRELRQLLGGVDRTTLTGKRDYAMLRCLVDLGLRAAEVAGIHLEDVEWRRGAVRIARSKARRADWLPLPPALGAAIADYLRRGRPRTTSRSLFVRHKLPTGSPIHPRVVGQAVQRAARAAGLVDCRVSPHVLRHTTATMLLRRGASLKQIAELLRHRSIDTTAIYAKVDLGALAKVALPWPRRMA
jgi:integrase/recombinase XerD